MTDYDNTNRGAIWKNDKKESDKHPDFTGNLNVDGVDYWVSAWKRSTDAGDKAPVLRFSIRAKDCAPNMPQSNNAPPNDFDDSIPF